MPTCTVEYDNKSKGVFYSGQIVNGTVLFVNEKSRKIYSISLNFEGFAKCKWVRTQGKVHTTYRGRENYINEVKYLIQSDVKGKSMELAGGLHKFKFSFRIPEQVPTSIEAFDDGFNWGGQTSNLRGCVRYLLTVKVNRASFHSDIKFEFPLTVIKNFDLNFADPRYRVPATASDTKAFTFSSKALKMSVDMQRTAFVGGEKAKFLVSYNNESSTEVVQTKVHLVRIKHYTSDDPKVKTKIRDEGVKLSTFEGVAAKTAKNVEAHLVIPSCAPTSDGSCRVLKISYEMHITAVFGGMHSDHTLKIPVIIGTIPFVSPELLPSMKSCETPLEFPFASAPPSATSSSSNQAAPNIRSIFTRDSIGWNLGPSTSSAPLPAASAPVPTTPESYDMPPPSYVEATAGKPLNFLVEPSDENARRPSINFNPSYPVYNFDQNQEEDLPPKYYR